MRLRTRVLFAAGVVFIFVSVPNATWGDIYQWEWVDPGDPSQGKQQSTTLCPDGAGLVAEPNFNASWKDLTQAYLHGLNMGDSGSVIQF